MKKLALLLAVMMLVLSVVGCGGAKAPASSAAPADPAAPAGEAKPAAPADGADGAPVSPETAWDGVQLTAIVGPDPDTIDPALNSSVDGGTEIKHIFEGLYTLDAKGVPVPGQAEKVDVSADGLTYTFTLRDGLKWSDGTPLTSEDFVYSWQRAIDPKTAADYAYMFECIDGYAAAIGNVEKGIASDVTKLNVKATDAKTLTVKLIAPTSYFLELTAFPTYMPVQKATVEKNGEKWALSAATYIGNGPYMMKEWVEGSHMLLEQNPNYWDVKSLGPKSIKFMLTDDDVAQLSAYKNGTVQFIDSVPNDEIETLKKHPDYAVMPQLGTYYVSFNVKKAPMDNPLVRKALILAVDRDFIVTNVGKADQIPAGAYVPPALTDADPTKSFRDAKPFYYDPSFEAYEANLAEAKKLLAEAGYPEGKGFPAIEYLYNAGTGHQQIGEALQSMWKELGINVSLVSQEWATFLQSRKNGDYFIARNGWLGDYNDPISFLDMWITGGGNNDAQWSNPAFDKLITEIKSTGDQKVRMQKMHEAEDIIFNESMLCPLYFYTDIYMLAPTIENYRFSPLGFKVFSYATPKK